MSRTTVSRVCRVISRRFTLLTERGEAIYPLTLYMFITTWDYPASSLPTAGGDFDAQF